MVKFGCENTKHCVKITVKGTGLFYLNLVTSVAIRHIKMSIGTFFQGTLLTSMGMLGDKQGDSW